MSEPAAMPTARYKFSRDTTSMKGFQSGNRASTDAINALSEWSNAVVSRSYEVQFEEDETLVADITWNETGSTAGKNLDDLCCRFGVTRSHVPSE
jgi:hypothetical protein